MVQIQVWRKHICEVFSHRCSQTGLGLSTHNQSCSVPKIIWGYLSSWLVFSTDSLLLLRLSYHTHWHTHTAQHLSVTPKLTPGTCVWLRSLSALVWSHQETERPQLLLLVSTSHESSSQLKQTKTLLCFQCKCNWLSFSSTESLCFDC